MQAITDVVKSISLEFSGSICKKHHKDIRKIVYAGREVCPVCESQKMNMEFESKVRQDVRKSKAMQNYHMLRKKSLINDISLFESGISNYKPYCEETSTNRSKVVRLLQRIQQGENMSLWFSGNTGVGKSHLAMAMLNNLNETSRSQVLDVLDSAPSRNLCGKTCLFVNVNMLMDTIRESFHSDSGMTPQYMVDLLTSVDFLVLDDVGSEVGMIDTNKTATDFVTRIMYQVVNGRQDKTTIYTTNLSSKVLRGLYDEKTFSRMTVRAETVVFRTAKDQRGGQLNF